MNDFSFIMTDMNDLNVFPADASLRRYVHAVARRLVRDPDDAEDVTQEALLLAYRYRDSFRGDSQYRTWLYRIATTAALSHLRRSRRRMVYLGTPKTMPELADPAPLPDARLAEAEQHEIVHAALAALAPTYREVLVARFDGTESEIAERLHISVANVKIRTHRARKQLRAILADRAA